MKKRLKKKKTVFQVRAENAFLKARCSDLIRENISRGEQIAEFYCLAECIIAAAMRTTGAECVTITKEDITNSLGLHKVLIEHEGETAFKVTIKEVVLDE